jgi:hypothetical protein
MGSRCEGGTKKYTQAWGPQKTYPSHSGDHGDNHDGMDSDSVCERTSEEKDPGGRRGEEDIFVEQREQRKDKYTSGQHKETEGAPAYIRP